ncbi:DoxX family protein [Rhodococcus wratislaviensis]|uniref:DoxX family protein n=1 Tax=Rhodococcus wratislaviensis NBRC 100605 TaxID=1219028 RepID=X0R9F8_RHOWR|nr:DoxX family protein [Rhodococcus wratislaviensis]GAF47625.1 hypothetical protein RW1_043_00600 [Rhodococcus wratislaviensis NBRC 100605]
MDVNIGLLVMRLSIGGMLLVHGYNKIAGPGGITGTAGWFVSLGIRPARLHARVASVNEIVIGVLLIAGFVFPLAVAAGVGVMLVAALTDHRGKGFFVFKGGWEYVGLVAAVLLAMACTGPGEWSLDGVIGWHLAGLAWALGAAVVGAVSSWLFLLIAWRPEKAEVARVS